MNKHSVGIQESVLTLKELSEDEKIQMQCEAREMYEHDLASAKKDGIREGREVGLKEGLKKGLASTAAAMLKENMDLSLITKITGLSEEELQRIKVQNK